jgi:hypothetical protein
LKLPGVERAAVDGAKIRDHLLSDSHPVGRFKAAFFAALGYPAGGRESLAAGLRGHALDNEAVATQANEYAQKYEVRGRIEGPSGNAADLAAVWIVLCGEDVPRFVTAFPGARS